MLWTLYTLPGAGGRAASTATATPAASASPRSATSLVVAEGVNFWLSEARLGLLPATISPYVVRAMGEQAARRYFVTAERFGAAEAQAMGFAHEVCAADALDAKVDELVAALVANGPMATRACKKLVQDVAGREITPELRAETARRIADIRASAEGKEGVAELPRASASQPGCLPLNLDLDPAGRASPPRSAGRAGCASTRWSSSPASPARSAGSSCRAACSILQSPWLLGASGVLLFVEFFVDKIPGLDTRLGRAAHA